MQSQLLLAAAFGFAGTVAAQEPATPDLAQYRSAFDGYRGWQTQPALDWRRVNDQMQHLGGHAGHVRTPLDRERSDEPAARAVTSSSPATTTKPAHGAHDTHGNNKR